MKFREAQKTSIRCNIPYKQLLQEEKDFRLPKYESRNKRDNYVRNRIAEGNAAYGARKK